MLILRQFISTFCSLLAGMCLVSDLTECWNHGRDSFILTFSFLTFVALSGLFGMWSRDIKLADRLALEPLPFPE